MFHKILVALDQTDFSQQVFDTAISLAQTLDAQLMLVHVLSPLEASYPSPVFALSGVYPMLRTEDVEVHWQQWRMAETAGLEFLQSRTAVATAAGVTAEFTQALGDPGRAICALARTWEANLILIGRRGYKGLGEFFVGSVSNYVVHHAGCSVLTVQGNIDLDQEAVATASVAEPVTQ
jgi:nucleotide-binding universal stress UspA family protein